MFFMKLGLLRRGVMNERAHFPATVTEESWPSLASKISINSLTRGLVKKDLLMFGVINIHCGSLLAAKSLLNMVKFLI